MYFQCDLLHISFVPGVRPNGADPDNSKPEPKCFVLYAFRFLVARCEWFGLFGDNKYANSDHN